MPEAGQMLDRLLDPAPIVGYDREDTLPLERAVDEHERDALFERTEDQAVARRRARDDEPVDLAAPKSLEHLALAFGLAIGVRQESGVARGGQAVLDPPHDRGEERIREIGDHDPDAVRAPSSKPTCQAVGFVVEAPHGGLDTAGGLRGHEVAGLGVEHTRDRGGIDAGELSDFAKGHARGRHHRNVPAWR